MKSACGYSNKAFIATAIAFDEEMKKRIMQHKKDRNDEFLTIEESLDIAAAVRSLPENIDVAIIDCLTVWLGNLMHNNNVNMETLPEIEAFINVLDNPPCDLIIVANEVGSGIVPENQMARQFRDIAGKLNQQTASKAQNVILVTCGIPMYLKSPAIQK